MENSDSDALGIKNICLTEQKKTKKINCEKEKKLRIETQTWGLNEMELSHDYQLNMMNYFNVNNDIDLNNKKYCDKLTSHLKTKLSSYKQQDLLKHKFNIEEFVSLECVIDLLKECELKCHYCSKCVYVLYEHVRDMKQWTLDRIDNAIGHNKGNLVISCLECNLKRRRTNKDAFMFTKNMKIIKEGCSN